MRGRYGPALPSTEDAAIGATGGRSRGAPGVRRSRCKVDGEVHVHWRSREWRLRLVDLSLTGVRFRRSPDFPLAEGNLAQLELRCGGQAIRMRGRIARLAGNDAAFRFEGLSAPAECELRATLEHHGRLRDSFDE